jgi:hypothetical protein
MRALVLGTVLAGVVALGCRGGSDEPSLATGS